MSTFASGKLWGAVCLEITRSGCIIMYISGGIYKVQPDIYKYSIQYSQRYYKYSRRFISTAGDIQVQPEIYKYSRIYISTAGNI